MRIDPVSESPDDRSARFFLYVEGPRDNAILREWAYRLLPSIARRLFRASVILGGRRPARAVEHFRRAGGREHGIRGLCILDRDDGAQPVADSEPGLEFFTWGRRHIESYLLVPDAICRTLQHAADIPRVQRALKEHLPAASDEAAYRCVDAKRLLAPKGPLPSALGYPISLHGVARATRWHELHPDVHDVFDRLRERLGVEDHPIVRPDRS
ncbi:MAG: hypothetical protein AAEJ52_14085 [Myxococcota bacterium]